MQADAHYPGNYFHQHDDDAREFYFCCCSLYQGFTLEVKFTMCSSLWAAGNVFRFVSLINLASYAATSCGVCTGRGEAYFYDLKIGGNAG